MVAGLSLAAWALIAGAVGAGLLIELAFLRAQRKRRPGETTTVEDLTAD